MQIIKHALLYNLLILLGLSSCGAHLSHLVERGETLYSISWMYGYDYQKVAQWNGIKPPYVIKPGDWLRLEPGQEPDNAVTDISQTSTAPVSESLVKPRTGYKRQATQEARQDPKREPIAKKAAVSTAKLNTSLQSNRQQDQRILNRNAYLKWQWPTTGGKVVSTFEASDPGKRGLDIAGTSGQAVMAAADGEVVYSGGGLPHYGKLIIVKHNDVYLSAYAHNRHIYVAEGDAVRRGQHIADMGSSGASNTRLHFEIRRHGKAVDPLGLLPTSPASAP